MKRLCLALMCAAAFSSAAYCADKKSDKMNMTVAAGEEVAIKLESNPSTGYSWIVNNLEELQKLILIADDYEETLLVLDEPADETSAAEEIVGVPGKQIFTFKAADGAEGIEELRFSYLRVWEKGVTPVEEIVVEVTVK